ncbi:MAG TPA: hypothetical protein VF574_10235 [Allosphingosinicella sp.]|jgi:hypothetical protein
MNKLLLSMAAVGAIAVAAPAASQSWNNNSDWNANAGGAMGISNQIARLDARISAGISSGEISRTEARNLRMELRQLRQLERQYSYNGLTQMERQDLRTRIRDLREDVRIADNGRYDRDSRYSWDDRYDNNDVYSGRGGPYEQSYDTYCDTNNRGVIGGVIDSVLGRNDNYNCTLRVGSRATGNLYSVPSQYRYRFRDGNGVYYRSDGRNIYQIDARSNTVLRVYDVD